MGGEFGGMIASVGLAVLIGGLILMFWPFRREPQFIFRRLIAAPRERVWDTYRIDLEDPRSAAMHQKIVSARQVGDDPVIHEVVYDSSSGQGTDLTTMRFETRIDLRPELSEVYICELDGKQDPFGSGAIERMELQDHPDGTLTVLTCRCETPNLLQFILLWGVSGRYMRRLRKICESEEVAPAASSSRSLWSSLIISVLAVGSFALWVGWAFALVLAAVAILHEYGHWLAMRLTGQPAPRVMLVPFFGGIAVANHPHKTQFDDAFCSLMGAGFSALVCIGLLVPAFVLDMPPPDDAMVGQFAGFLMGRSDLVYGWADFSEAFSIEQMLVIVSLLLAVLVGLLNLLQLLPILPLDGGHILRSMMQSFSAKWAQRVLLVIAGLTVTILIYEDLYLFAGFAGLGALQAWYLSDAEPTARPMSLPGLVVIALGFGLTVTIHLAAIGYGGLLLGLDSF